MIGLGAGSGAASGRGDRLCKGVEKTIITFRLTQKRRKRNCDKIFESALAAKLNLLFYLFSIAS